MSTSNFYTKNIDSIYAVELNNEFEYDILIEDIREKLITNEEYNFSHEDGSDYDRNYEGNIFANGGVSFNFCDVSVNISIDTIIRAGYYTGANFDYDVTVTIEDEEIDWFDYYGSIENVCSYWIEQYNNKGLAELHKTNLVYKIENTVTELIDFVESVYKQYSTELAIQERFSNGETIYTVA